MFLINGSTGQLGSELVRLLGDQAVGVNREQFDIQNREQVSVLLRSMRPSVIINCAAYTAVDLAEEDEHACRSINGESVKHLADISAEIDATLVQISTDYVFAGATDEQGPLTEDVPASPMGVYATSKREGEINAARCPKHLIIRTCGLYGVTPKRSNFVETMLRVGSQRDELSVVNDQFCNPTSTLAVATAIEHLVERQCIGTFHVVSTTPTSWFEFAKEIFRQASMPTQVVPITTEQYGAKAPRPRYSVLDSTKYVLETGHPMPALGDDLATYLASRG